MSHEFHTTFRLLTRTQNIHRQTCHKRNQNKNDTTTTFTQRNKTTKTKEEQNKISALSPSSTKASSKTKFIQNGRQVLLQSQTVIILICM